MPLTQPPIRSNQTYTIANVTPDRSFDPTNTSTSETNQVLGTLIQDLKTAGNLQ